MAKGKRFRIIRFTEWHLAKRKTGHGWSTMCGLSCGVFRQVLGGLTKINCRACLKNAAVSAELKGKGK